MTTREIIASYSRSVRDGYSDADLSKRQRHYVHVLLNLASNDNAYMIYPPNDDSRLAIIRGMFAKVHDVRWFLSSAEESDFDMAAERAREILSNL